MHKIFSLMWSQLWIFVFVAYAVGICMKTLPFPVSWTFSLMFSSRSFMLSGFMLVTSIHLEVSLCGVRQGTTFILLNAATAAAKSLQLCLTLCNPIDGSPPGSPVPGILQARTLEWVAISFSNAWKRKVKGKSLSCVWLLATPWTAAYQAPPSMGFSRQEYWSGLPLSSPPLIVDMQLF